MSWRPVTVRLHFAAGTLLLLAGLARADGGAVELGHLLQRLPTTARVLHTGAHPDDEDSALLALLTKGYGARVAYLSLNRGEGGQNSIGPELYDALGLVRTEELLAARQLDGAEQYFSSVFDFGFSKTADESLRLWGREPTLGEIVAVIRRFRPQVIISRFAGTPADGHGHHQVAGLLTREAFRAAADPARFPEQLRAGLPVWQASKLYLDLWQRTDSDTTLEAGDLSPLDGRTYVQLALAGRSRHRSQDMGRVEPAGPYTIRLKLLDQSGTIDRAAGLFEGLQLTLPDLVPAGPGWRSDVNLHLLAADQAVRQAVDEARLGPRSASLGLALARAKLELDAAAGQTPADAPLEVRSTLTQKLDELSAALAAAAGLAVDALADLGRPTPGEAVTVVGQAWWPESVEQLTWTLTAPPGWPVTPVTAPPLLGSFTPRAAQGWRVTVPANAPASQPYWLRQPRQGNRFSSPPDLAGQPFEPPLLLVRAHAVIDGAPVDLVRPVTARWADPRRGERRRELQVQPRLNAVLKPALTLLTPARHEPLRWAVTVENATPQPQTGEVGLRLAGAALGAGQTVTLAAGERRRVLLSAPAPAAGGVARLVWRTAADETPLSTVHDIDYDHLPPRQYLAPAEARLAAVDVAVDRTRAIGYVPGPGDGVPEALAELGLPVKPLDAGTLDEPGALDGLRTVVVGLRAYEVNDGLRRQNSRLLDWVRQGGTLVVLYQKTPYATPGLAPFPLTYAEPHDRVTDETAAVRLLQPEHPLLSRPNGITPADFTGWVQELGLYFAHTWDSAYQPLLASHDPGEPDRLGGLLVANCGQGAYVYCGYALFRQLPVGVPGAYRLLANLVAYGR